MTFPANVTRPESAISLYERLGERTTQPYALQVLDMLGQMTGAIVLDVAAGTGGLAVVAADRGAHVLAMDLSPEMIERTKERLSSYNLCIAQVMDFQSLDIPDAAADIVVSNFGVLAYPTWHQGLNEMVRVTKPHGLVALSMWTHDDDCSPAHLMKRVFHTLFPERSLWPPGMFTAFNEDNLKSALVLSGCTHVHVHVASAEWSPHSSAHVIAECDPMFQSFEGYASLSTREARNLHTALADAFHSYSDADGIIRMPTKAFVAIGRKAS